jgi:hypothetical protein
MPFVRLPFFFISIYSFVEKIFWQAQSLGGISFLIGVASYQPTAFPKHFVVKRNASILAPPVFKSI